MDFTAEEKLYYKNHMLLPNFGEDKQYKLKSSKVLVIGAGGLGCPVLTYLSLAGIGKIGICDGDTINYSNMTRQSLFDYDNVGQSKAYVAAAVLRKKNPFIEIEPIDTYLTADNVLEIMNQYDLILDCADNFQLSFLVNDIAYFLNKSLIQGALYQFEGLIYGFDFSKEKKSPCFRCFISEEPKNKCTDCSLSGIMGVNAGIVGLYQANLAINYLSGTSPIENGKQIFIDPINYSTRIMRFAPSSDCMLCSDKAYVKSIEKAIDKHALSKFETTAQEAIEQKLFWYSMPVLKPDVVKQLEDKLGVNIKPIEKIDLSSKANIGIVCLKGYSSLFKVKELRASGFEQAFSIKGGATALLDEADFDK